MLGGLLFTFISSVGGSMLALWFWRGQTTQALQNLKESYEKLEHLFNKLNDKLDNYAQRPQIHVCLKEQSWGEHNVKIENLDKRITNLENK